MVPKFLAVVSGETLIRMGATAALVARAVWKLLLPKLPVAPERVTTAA
jgi:hypothetical protein